VSGVGCLLQHVPFCGQRKREREGTEDRSRHPNAQQEEITTVGGEQQRFGSNIADAFHCMHSGEIEDLGMLSGVDHGRRPLDSVDVDRGPDVENRQDRRCCAVAQDGPISPLMAVSTEGEACPVALILLSHVRETWPSCMAAVSVPMG